MDQAVILAKIKEQFPDYPWGEQPKPEWGWLVNHVIEDMQDMIVQASPEERMEAARILLTI